MVHVAVWPAVRWVVSVQVLDPDDDVAVSVVSADPPLFGTVQDTLIEAVELLAPIGDTWATVTPVGMPG